MKMGMARERGIYWETVGGTKVKSEVGLRVT
jgi:hypothetical protein